MVYAGWLGSNYFTAPLKYLVQAVQSLWILLRHRPRGVLVMAPPVVACFPVWLYCVLFRARFAIDAHTGAFLNPRWKRLQLLQRFCSRRAATTIVTNDYLKEMVERWGAHATIVPDVPVCFPEPEPVELPPGINITVVASFCPDEPIAEILEAARQVPEVNFHVTGNYRKLNEEAIATAPTNVRFLGFVSHERYTGQLLASDAVIALTTRDHTMQRAAYEAIYLGRPVITSDFPVLRQSFAKGAVHVRPTAADIEVGIREMASDDERYIRAAEDLREEKLQAWMVNAEAIRRRLRIGDARETECSPTVNESKETLESPNTVAMRR